MQLFIELQEALRSLEETTDHFRISGQEAAKAEAEYQKAKAIRALELKAQDNSASMINLRIKGDAQVNGYLMDRECTRALYEADKELINTLKLKIRIIESQLQREYQG